MTSASELFHIRRNNRFGGSRIALDLGFHHHDDADSLRLRLRRRYHPHPHPEPHAPERIDGVGRHRRSVIHDRGVVDSGENVRATTSGAGDRLPAGVLLARERLLRRLRGEPLSGNRQNGSDSMGEDQDQESHELSSDVPMGGSLGTPRMGRFQLLQELNNKPPGLTQEAVDSLHVEVFSNVETRLESRVQDCGICLESFTDGDELIRLPCGHKFHSACLDPWIRCCGDCPYCRQCVVVNTN